MNTPPQSKAAVNTPHSKRFANHRAFGSRVSVWSAVALAPLLSGPGFPFIRCRLARTNPQSFEALRSAGAVQDPFWKILSIWLLLMYVTPAAVLAAEDERPVVDASKVPVEKASNPALPTFHIVGDSTVRSGGTGVGLWGWGERIQPFFDTNKINVVNHAIGGRSARTYFNEGRWQKVADALKPGDFVIIQFGHNDQGRIGDPAMKGRPDGKGIGDETVEDTKPDGTKELVHTFGWYMAKFATEAKAHHATAIICSPIPHKQRWENERDFATIAEWDSEVASNTGALYFDLTLVITDAYKKAGAEKVETFFADKGTHTTDTGAQFNAACVVAGLRSLPGDPLASYLSEKGRGVESWSPLKSESSTNTPATSSP
jgi:lysophospholipase L1-like esterase